MQSVPLNKLVLSKLNVRKVAPTGIEALADNIHAVGLIHGLTATAEAGDMFAVVAGGRRLAALQLLAKRKLLDVNFPVSVEVVSIEKAHEVGLSENAMREDMHPADQFEAFAKMAADGHGEETIAAHFGVTPVVVRQRMKLAVVSPKLIALYRKGDMTLEQLTGCPRLPKACQLTA